MQVEKIPQKRLYEGILEQLMTLIQNGTLKPGDMLPPERELAEQFGISRGTLREAFRVMEANGFIYNKHGGGRYVKDAIPDNSFAQSLFQKATVADVYEIRMTLEPTIAELAAQRATDEDIADLDESYQRMLNGESTTYQDDNSYFHIMLANASHNLLMADIIKLYTDLMANWSTNLDNNYPYEQRRQDILKEHRKILEAVKQHDGPKARQAMLDHISRARSKRLAIEKTNPLGGSHAVDVRDSYCE